MFKNKIKTIITHALAGVVFILSINFAAYYYNHRENGFVRIFPPHRLSLHRVLDLKYNSYYFAGNAIHHFYLGNYSSPARIIQVDYNLIDSQSSHFRFCEKISILSTELFVFVDSPHITVMDGKSPLILATDLKTLNACPIYKPAKRFNAGTPLSTNSFILRMYDKQRDKNVLAKASVFDSGISTVPDLLKKQVDGFFCTDGLLSYLPGSSTLIYLYFYRNSFLLLDTNLRLKYTGRTIDTNSVAKLAIYYEKDGSRTFGKPPLLVNNSCSVTTDWLAIQSGLAATNENARSFKTSTDIDFYKLTKGSYSFSIAVPDYDEKKVSSFIIKGNQLFTLQDHYLISYDLQF